MHLQAIHPCMLEGKVYVMCCHHHHFWDFRNKYASKVVAYRYITDINTIRGLGSVSVIILDCYYRNIAYDSYFMRELFHRQHFDVNLYALAE